MLKKQKEMFYHLLKTVPFIKNSNELDIWSQDYFKQLFEKMIIN